VLCALHPLLGFPNIADKLSLLSPIFFGAKTLNVSAFQKLSHFPRLPFSLEKLLAYISAVIVSFNRANSPWGCPFGNRPPLTKRCVWKNENPFGGILKAKLLETCFHFERGPMGNPPPPYVPPLNVAQTKLGVPVKFGVPRFLCPCSLWGPRPFGYSAKPLIFGRLNRQIGESLYLATRPKPRGNSWFKKRIISKCPKIIGIWFSRAKPALNSGKGYPPLPFGLPPFWLAGSLLGN